MVTTSHIKPPSRIVKAVLGGEGTEVTLTELGLKKGVGVAGHHVLWGVPIATAVLAVLSLWDHHKRKSQIADEYKDEIAAYLGKPRGKVDLHDMEKVAEENPAIGEAIQRSKARRNLSVAVTIAGAIAGLALVAAFAPAGVVAGFIASSLGFLAVEEGLEMIGKKVLGLSEPSFEAINRTPSRQTELSVPGQINYLEHQQAKGRLITQEQVMTVFASANPELAARIKTRYGADFAKLGDSAKRQALEQFGSQYPIEELTADINNRHTRVQELAFAAYGQESGAQAAGVSSVAEIKREQAQAQQKIEELNAQLQAQAPATNQDVAPSLADGQDGSLWGARVTTGDLRKPVGGMSPALSQG